MQDDQVSIFFVHRGYSDYLPVTLSIARRNSPSAECYLIGDESNRQIAQECRWTHVPFEVLYSAQMDHFRSVYRLLSSKNHPDTYLPYDMTQFCFERYFYAVELARRKKLESFWMLDSDDIVCVDLGNVQEILRQRGVMFTRMAHDTALRGLMNCGVTEAFCRYVIELYKNGNFVDAIAQEMAQRSEIAAFTDMSAGAMFKSSLPSAHLATAVPGWYFDDCIFHEDGFATVELGHLRKLRVKHVTFNGRYFVGMLGGNSVNFGTINGSGLPRQIFPWFMDCINGQAGEKPIPGDIRAYQPSRLRELAYLAKQAVRSWI